MASAKGDDSPGWANPLWAVCLVGLLLCCGFPVYAWRTISTSMAATEKMRPVVTSFLDAWRDGDWARAEPLSCAYRRADLARLVREDDLVSYGEVKHGSNERDTGTDHYAEADLTFADGRRDRYRLELVGKDNWWVCQVSRKNNW